MALALTADIRKRVCASAVLPMPEPALSIEPADVERRLPEVRARLADVASYRGEEGDHWELWLACVDASGAPREDAARALSEDGGFWLAAWCFTNGLATLGLVAHERYLQTETGPNPHRDFAYALEALRLGQPGRAYAALSAAHDRAGLFGSDEALMAAVGFASGAIDAGAARTVLVRIERACDQLAKAAVAVGYDVLGDSPAALEIVGGFHRGSPFASNIARLLVDRFGETFTAAMAREPAPVHDRKRRLPGLVAKRSRTRTPHLFAPGGPSGPACKGCGHPIRVWWSLDLGAINVLEHRLPKWGLFNAPACLDCNLWMMRHDYAAGPAGELALREVEPAPKDLGCAFDTFSSRPIATQYAKLVKAPRDLDARPLDGDCQVGGEPAWIQDPVEVSCPGCREPMIFVLRFSAPNDFENCPPVAGASGALYYFACAGCRRVSCIAQWT